METVEQRKVKTKRNETKRNEKRLSTCAKETHERLAVRRQRARVHDKVERVVGIGEQVDDIVEHLVERRRAAVEHEARDHQRTDKANEHDVQGEESVAQVFGFVRARTIGRHRLGHLYLAVHATAAAATASAIDVGESDRMSGGDAEQLANGWIGRHLLVVVVSAYERRRVCWFAREAFVGAHEDAYDERRAHGHGEERQDGVGEQVDPLEYGVLEDVVGSAEIGGAVEVAAGRHGFLVETLKLINHLLLLLLLVGRRAPIGPIVERRRDVAQIVQAEVVALLEFESLLLLLLLALRKTVERRRWSDWDDCCSC